MSLPFGVEQLQEAWEGVQENEGCADSDAVTIRQFAHHAEKRLPELLERVRDGRYRPYPLPEDRGREPGCRRRLRARRGRPGSLARLDQGAGLGRRQGSLHYAPKSPVVQTDPLPSKWSTYSCVAAKWRKMNGLVRFARKAKSGVASGKSFVFWQKGWIWARFSTFGRGVDFSLDRRGDRQITMLSHWNESG